MRKPGMEILDMVHYPLANSILISYILLNEYTPQMCPRRITVKNFRWHR